MCEQREEHGWAAPSDRMQSSLMTVRVPGNHVYVLYCTACQPPRIHQVCSPPTRTHTPPTAGKVLIHQVRGEEAGNAVLTIELSKGEAGYIEQGAFHTVENVNGGVSRFLQIFDHPQGGAVFAAPSLVALPRRLVNSAFTDNVLRRDTSAAKGVIIPIRGCRY